MKSESKVSVVLQENRKVVKEIFASGLIVLTNFRVITVLQTVENSKSVTIGWGFMLKTVSSVEDCARMFKLSTRLRLSFLSNNKEIGLRFEKDGKEEFLVAIQKSLDRKSWERNMVLEKTSQPTTEEDTVFSSTNAGVAGIMRRQERNLQSVDNLAKSALTDLDALMFRAREAIAVVQRYASYTAGEEERDDTLSDTTSQVAEKNEMETIMQNIGIVSPVTKFSAGRKYHEQLARQMADLLLQQGRIDRLGGMITLTDLYCLFNRARGTELVSPDDLLKAATLSKKLNLGLKLRVFDSGVKVLQADSHSEEVVGQRILSLCSEARFSEAGVQASDLALQLNISLLVAKEQLLMAENNRFVCRDESTEGLFFFPNLFETKWSTAA